MKTFFLKLLLVGCCLTAYPLQAREASSPSSTANESKIEALQAEFEQEMKAQLAQKNIEDYSFKEISDIALQASKKVYGIHPQLMKQQTLSDLQQLPSLDSRVLSNYEVKEALNLNDLSKEITGLSDSGTGRAYDDLLPIFYNKKPEYIAYMLKNMMLTQHLGAQQFSQRAMISQFMPDKTYRIRIGEQPKLAVKTFEDDLFITDLLLTEAGLLKPLKIEWLQLKTAKPDPVQS